MSSKILEIIREVAIKMREDFVKSRESELIRLRSEAYRAFYKVSPLVPREQEAPIVFVDAGFNNVETDVSVLYIINIGGCVRDEEGRVRYVHEICDMPPYETYFVYGRWVQGGKGSEFVIRFIPVDENPVLIRPESAPKISEEITAMLNKQTSGSDLKLMSNFKKFVNYVEGLMEIAYGIKLKRFLLKKPICVIDGTLIRWFSVKRSLKSFKFDGLNVLEKITGIDRDVLINELNDVMGLTKTTKFTSFARAREIFYGNVERGDLGLYSYVDEESVEKASSVIEDIRIKYGVDMAMDTINLFNKLIFPRNDIWGTRFPITTSENTVFHLEKYIQRPLINIERGMVVFNSKLASELGKTIPRVSQEIFLYRTPVIGQLPHGFMEVDEMVRLKNETFRDISESFVQVIREITGTIGHPLEYMFMSTQRMRIGYR
ncbi:MAG: hypothetical protein QXS23_03085 [Desulfurococcaceae archaeon]